MKPTLIFPVLAAIFISASCASSDSATAKKSAKPVQTGAKVRTADEWLAETTKDNGYTTDASGNFVPKSNKRSSFENKGESTYFKKDFKKQEYKTGDFQKKSWWGNKEYDRQSYAGNTDGSRFAKASSEQGKGARESDHESSVRKDYETNSYATNAARETGKSDLAKPSNDGIENRRGVFTPPEVIDWREQRTMSLEQTKGLLGH